MASPLFEVEDQTDEDFFDKLVNDDDDGITSTGFAPSLVKADDSDKEKAAFGEVSRVDSGGDFDFSVEDSEGDEDGVILASSDNREDTLVDKESNAAINSNVNESSEVGLVEEGATYDVALDKSNLDTGTGVKEVNWNSFNSELKADGGSGLQSYSDFFNDFGDDTGDPFANMGNTDSSGPQFNGNVGVLENSGADLGSSGYGQTFDIQTHEQSSEQNIEGQDSNNSHNWENLYPGWKYDSNTGQWHPLDAYNADISTTANTDVVESFDVNAKSLSDQEQISDIYHLQQEAQSGYMIQSVAEGATNVSVSNWSQISLGTTEYPSHMVFDPQYPGWYYDMIAQEWRLLESSPPATDQLTTSAYQQQLENNITESYGSQGLGSQGHVMSWVGSVSNSDQKNTNTWQSPPVAESETTGVTDNKQSDNSFSSIDHVNNSAEQQIGYNSSETSAPFEQASWSFDNSNAVSGLQNFTSSQKFSQHHNQIKMQPSQQMHFKPSYFDGHKPVSFSQQKQLQSVGHFSYVPSEGRSSAGRPPHALVTFGFGGKLVVLKDCSSSDTNSSFGRKDSFGGVVNVLNLMEVVDKPAVSSFGVGACDYFQTLCQQSFPGPLVGGNVGNKELNKWIDERIANCEYSNIDSKNGKVMRLLFSLLKITCQHYGKLRSPFGADSSLEESNCPESAVAKLFGSAENNSVQFSNYGALPYCFQSLPAEAQIQATALEVQKLLVSGRKKEALHCAQEGQLWGPALVIASQLGDQFYGDTVKQMALKQLVAGSPLRTLCLLIAGQPADVFSDDKTFSAIPDSVNIFQQSVQIGPSCILDKWEENLAIITANRTKSDELVIIHLGDCLWKDRGEVTAAHVCYLVAESNFEPYSDNARLCLIGADHLKFPRTYASPEAIQRTELYEYAKVLGNPQFILLPFQPYKLIYAHMLAEVGKVADSLKYCQAILKSLKTGRTPEVETWKQLVLSLEERLRTHQQGGYTTNLVGKLRTFFDSTANRVVGSVPPSIPSKSHDAVLYNEFAHKQGGQQVSSSYSSMAIDSTANRVVGSVPPSIPSKSYETVLYNEFAHKQGGQQVSSSYSSMAIDSTANRVVGSVPPSIPSKSHDTVLYNEFAHKQGGQQVSSSYSSMATSTLMSSASVEPISEWTGETNILDVPNRSISEPEFGRSPSKVDSSKKSDFSDTKEKVSVSSGSSRFGRFGSQLFQKTVGLVLRSHPDRQAKLGEKNKFYYDEKLKRWVEEGAEPPAEEPVLAPPPTFAAFHNGMPDNNINDAPNIESFHTTIGQETQSPITSDRVSGIPPIPPNSNQFSTRGRMGIRSRYVDTFNKGSGIAANLFQSSPIPKSGGGTNPKFFIPTPVASGEEMIQTTGETIQEVTVTNENFPTSSISPPPPSLKESISPPPTSFKESISPSPTSFKESISPPPSFKESISPPPTSASSSAMTVQRFPSMDNIIHKRTGVTAGGNNLIPTQSRRASSWSGSLSNAGKPPGEAVDAPTTPYSDPLLNQNLKSGSVGDAFHEVEL